MSTTDQPAVRLIAVGKMYRVFRSRGEQVVDALGASRLLPPARRPRPREFWALRGFDLELARGQRIGIIGRNGAGKTTMLKLITQDITATEGTVEVRGQVQALMTAGAGFHPEFTGYENINAALTYQGYDRATLAEAIADIADFTEIGEFLGQPFRTYSAGMQARLAFATATAMKPETLIIDEMLGAGDAYFLGKSNERMTALVESGASVLLVSHSSDQILRFCDQAVWLDRGRVVQRGPSLEVVKSYEQFTRTIQERRVQARNRKRRAGLTPAHDRDERETLVVRLAVSGESAALDVRELGVLEDNDSLETLHVGGPQDGDPSHQAFVALEGSDWSDPQFSNGLSWRTLAAPPGHPGATGSAIFGLFALSSGRRYGARLRYRAVRATGATVAIWRDGELVAEAELPVQSSAAWRETLVPIEASMHVGAGSPTSQPADLHQDPAERRVSRWPGERSIIIDDVVMEGVDGRERAIFERGEALSLRLRVKARRPGPFTLIPVAVLYRLDGIRISPHIGDRAVLDLDVGETADIRLVFDHLNLGGGRYIFSLALYRTLTAVAPEIYDIVDRSYEFEVRQDDPLRDGIFEHPSRWEIT